MSNNIGLDRRCYNGAPSGISQFRWEALLDGWRAKRQHWSFNEALRTKRARKRGRTAAQQAIIDSI